MKMNADIFNEMLKKASYGKGVLKPCIDEIEALRQQLDAANTLINTLQAEVDALMLEYCPSEMSQEQLDNWAAHQRSVEEK